MKELSIEEKARAYDEALKVAKDIRNGVATYIPNGTPVIEAIFPELAESEDEMIRKHLIKHFGNKSKEDWNGVPVKSILVWLEKQGEQKPAEWSEEDNVNLNYIIKVLGRLYERNDKAYLQESLERKIKWLKSLRPQSHWKPSDEQMNALNYVVNLMASSERPTENDLYYNILKSLRQQLKKLMEDKLKDK